MIVFLIVEDTTDVGVLSVVIITIGLLKGEVKRSKGELPEVNLQSLTDHESRWGSQKVFF